MFRSSVTRQYDKLEEGRISLLQKLAKTDENVLHRKPAAGKWSVIQIIFHLNSSEQISLKYMMKKSQGGNAIPKSGIQSSLRSWLLKLALRFLKWKKPQILPDPPDNLDSKPVLQDWEQTRMQLKDFLEQLPDDLVQRNIFRHPAAGRMNAMQALEFMQDHFNHHLKQIESLFAVKS